MKLSNLVLKPESEMLYFREFTANVFVPFLNKKELIDVLSISIDNPNKKQENFYLADFKIQNSIATIDIKIAFEIDSKNIIWIDQISTDKKSLLENSEFDLQVAPNGNKLYFYAHAHTDKKLGAYLVTSFDGEIYEINR